MASRRVVFEGRLQRGIGGQGLVQRREKRRAVTGVETDDALLLDDALGLAQGGLDDEQVQGRTRQAGGHFQGFLHGHRHAGRDAATVKRCGGHGRVP
jgi:hypothetical protein